jgi:hypothetical protein
VEAVLHGPDCRDRNSFCEKEEKESAKRIHTSINLTIDAEFKDPKITNFQPFCQKLISSAIN